jgi:hypothetical protein
MGQSDISTTLAIYGHYEDEDLESAMDSYGRWLEAQENVLLKIDKIWLSRAR